MASPAMIPIPGQARSAPPTMEEALGMIQAKRDEKGGLDSFKVKVHRRAGLGSPVVHVASLEEATVNHLANPEQWLPALAGGGPVFVLAVAHASEDLPFVFFSPPNLNGAPKQVIIPRS